MKIRYYLAAAALVAAAIALFAWVLPQLPAQVPVHWNLHGVADRHGSPWELFLAGPVLMAAMTAMFAALPWLSPRRFGVESFERTYLTLMLIVVAALGYVFASALWLALHPATARLPMLLGGIAVMCVLVGNLMGKVRRNFFIGIRTPWTLASERVWYATHRFAGKSIVTAGAAALVLAIAEAPVIAFTLVLLAGFLAPVAYSLAHYKRLERRGELDLVNGPA